MFYGALQSCTLCRQILMSDAVLWKYYDRLLTANEGNVA